MRKLPTRRERRPSSDGQAPRRVRISGLTKKYPGSQQPAVANLSLDVEPGSFFSLLGPSGCGKTTIMRCIAGLEKPDEGEIWVDDSLIFSSERGIDVPSHQRQMGMVFQSYAIWPHKTVFGNVAYPLKNLGIGRAEIVQRVSEVLQTVGLHAKSNSSATLLSGGEQQRVALARAIVARPRLLLLDEPLSNLDAKLREQMRLELGRLQKLLGITTIYVTHDQHEAFSMSGSMAILHTGKIVELGDPETVYRTPASLAGAQFLGTSARFRGRVLSSTDQAIRVDTALGPIDCRSRVTPPADAEVWVCLRPESIRILPGTETPPGLTLVDAQVTQVAFHGSTYEWWAEANGIAIPGHSPADSPEGDLLRDSANHNVRLGISRAICILEQPDASGHMNLAGDVQQSASDGTSSSMSTASA